MADVIYTAQRSGFIPGNIYRNPKYFEAPLGNETRVVVVGDWPKVVEAYRGAGIEVVTDHSAPPVAVAPIPAPNASEADSTAPEPSVTIPDNWRDLPWPSRKSLAAKLTDDPITDSESVERAIEAELARRED